MAIGISGSPDRIDLAQIFVLESESHVSSLIFETRRRRAPEAARPTSLRVDFELGSVARPHIGHRDRGAAREGGNGDGAVLRAPAAKLDGARARPRDCDPPPMARHGETPP